MVVEVLAVLSQLEQEQKAENQKKAEKEGGKDKTHLSYVSSGARIEVKVQETTGKAGPGGLSSSATTTPLKPPILSYGPPPPSLPRPFSIFTKTISLTSGFPYIPRLTLQKVTEQEWIGFSVEIVEAAKGLVPRHRRIFERGFRRRLLKELQVRDNAVALALSKWNNGAFSGRIRTELQIPALSESVGNNNEGVKGNNTSDVSKEDEKDHTSITTQEIPLEEDREEKEMLEEGNYDVEDQRRPMDINAKENDQVSRTKENIPKGDRRFRILVEPLSRPIYEKRRSEPPPTPPTPLKKTPVNRILEWRGC